MLKCKKYIMKRGTKVKIIYGKFCDNLTEALVIEVEKALSSKRPVFYLVPTSMSFDLERKILSSLSVHAQIDLQVLSFKRFVWYFTKNQELYKKTQLTENGKIMLFRRVLAEMDEAGELVIFKKEVNRIGFLTQLVELSDELNDSLIDLQDLNGSLKIDELALIIERFRKALSNDFRKENSIESFTKQLNSQDIDFPKNCLIVIEGFSRFTEEERLLVETLNNMGIDILVGAYASKSALNSPIIEGNVYEASVKFIDSLRFNRKIELVNCDYYYQDINNLDSRKIDKELTLFCQKWEEINSWTTTSISENKATKNSSSIEVWENINMVEEVKAVAKRIRLLTAQGVHYKDIQVLCGNIRDYNGIIQPVFDKQHIHYYFDDEVEQANHPLIEFVESLIDIKKYGFRYEDIMRLLRSELIEFNFPNLTTVWEKRKVIDQFELFLLKNGINSKAKFAQKWTKKDIEAIFSEDCELIYQCFILIQEKLTKKGQVFSNFLQTSSFINFMSVLSETAIVYQEFVSFAKNQDEINQHREAWDNLMFIANEYYSIYQNNDDYFFEMITAALKNASFKKIPSSINLVQIKSYELVQPNTADYIFVIGLTNSNFPINKNNNSILSDEERININNQSSNGKLQVINSENSSKALFSASQLFASARKHLYLSSPNIYLDEKVSPSNYIKRIVNELHVSKIQNQPINISQISLTQFGSYDGLLEDLGKIARDLVYYSEEEIENEKLTFWKIMYRILLKQNEKYKEIFYSLDESISPHNLSKETLEAQYPNHIHASVSSFENFYDCEYKYFLANSILLQEIDTLTLDNRVQGDYFHRVLQVVLENGFPMEKDFDKKMTMAINKVTQEFSKFFEYNSINQYFKAQFDNILIASTRLLKRQANSLINVRATEFSFGNNNLDSLIFELNQGKKLKVRGFIDRIDEINQSYGAIDYKSGKRTFNLEETIDGLQLQLLTYLDYLQNVYNDGNNEIWGASYLSLQEQVLKLNDLESIDENYIYQETQKKLKYNGIYTDEFLASLDPENKEFFYISKDRKGSETSKNHFPISDVYKLLENNKKLFVNAGNELVSGNVRINPAINSKKVAIGCQYCQFKSICRFEPNIHKGRKIGGKKLSDI